MQYARHCDSGPRNRLLEADLKGGHVNNNRNSIPLAVLLPLVLGGTLLIPSAQAADQSADGPCSNRTLKGGYGFKIDGQLLNGPVTGVLRALALTKFDGQGNLTQIDFSTINGIPRGTEWRPSTGVYSINPDCTGSAEITPDDGSPALKLRLVIVKRGKEIHTIVEGNPTGSVGIAVE
jgi:hypothetical protein